MMFFAKVFIVCFLWSGLALADDLDRVIDSKLSSQTVSIGQPLTMSVEIFAREALQYEDISETWDLQPFELLDYRLLKAQEQADGELVKHGLEFVLAAYEAGSFEIAPFELRFRSKQRERIAYQTPSMPVEVQSVLKEGEVPGLVRANKSSRELKDYLFWYWMFGLAFLAIVLCVVLNFLFERWRTKQSTKQVIVPLIPEEQEAFEALKALREEDLMGKGHVITYYVRLTDILRAYLQRRFEVLALEATSDEILKNLKHHPQLSRSEYFVLMEFLQFCDLVKFAKNTPSAAQSQKNYDQAWSFIKRTQRPRQQAQEGDDELSV